MIDSELEAKAELTRFKAATKRAIDKLHKTEYEALIKEHELKQAIKDKQKLHNYQVDLWQMWIIEHDIDAIEELRDKVLTEIQQDCTEPSAPATSEPAASAPAEPEEGTILAFMKALGIELPKKERAAKQVMHTSSTPSHHTSHHAEHTKRKVFKRFCSYCGVRLQSPVRCAGCGSETGLR